MRGQSNTFVLVYQGGLANLFRVPSSYVNPLFSWSQLDASQQRLASMDTVRVYQGDFRTAEAMARGAILAGAEVRIASRNVAGDVKLHWWAHGLSDCPFRDEANPPR
jgi:hypothetical protein